MNCFAVYQRFLRGCDEVEERVFIVFGDSEEQAIQKCESAPESEYGLSSGFQPEYEVQRLDLTLPIQTAWYRGQGS